MRNLVWIKGSCGYQIPCCDRGEGASKILIICHGFGSSQNSPMVEALRLALPPIGVGTVSFDFPAHGDSPVDCRYLRIQNCLEDLSRVEAYVQARYPDSEICYFGSSFGAYILLLYLAHYPQRNRRAFLRSAAVDMFGIVKSWIGQGRQAWQRGANWEEDYFIPTYDYVREMRITRALLEDLAHYDVFSLYPIGGLRLDMVHGEQDSTAPYQDAVRFARLAGAGIHLIPGAEHRLMGADELAQVLEQAKAFLTETS